MILKIVEFDEEILRRKATSPVEIPPSGDTKMLATNMLQTMIAAGGVGLACPQVDISTRMFVAELGGSYHIIINPEIVEYSDSKGTEVETCLSLPGVTGIKVRRSKIIRLNYFDASGKFFERKRFKGFDARIVQHEYDHLDGKLIIDYISHSNIESSIIQSTDVESAKGFGGTP